MKRKIVVVISLNTLGFDEKRFDENWLKYRIDIFMKYTRKSLESQTYQGFMAIVSYEKKSENIINKILSECTELPKNIIFTANGNEIIRNFIKNSDELLYVRLDSDDIYEPTYFERLMNYEFKKQDTQAIISQDGYVYDINEKRLATYHYYSPPFYAFRYNVDEFMNGLRYKPKGGHMGVINLKNEVINGNNFCVIIHGNNNQSTFNRLRRYGKEIVNNKDIKFVLDKFNIEV